VVCGRRLRSRVCASVGRPSGKVCGVGGREAWGRRAGRPFGACEAVPSRISSHHCWDKLEPFLARFQIGHEPGQHANRTRTVIYTPTVTATPRQVHTHITHTADWLSFVILQADDSHDPLLDQHRAGPTTELIIVDEADRLKNLALEQVRDHHDRTGVGVILIGMPGLEKRLTRYPQLYSRIGFAHQYRPLSAEELTFVLEHHYHKLGLTLTTDDFTDTEAVAAVARITGGNFRLVQRLFAQITRILNINNLTTITQEVVETARQNLVIGPP